MLKTLTDKKETPDKKQELLRIRTYYVRIEEVLESIFSNSERESRQRTESLDETEILLMESMPRKLRIRQQFVSINAYDFHD